MSDAIHTKMLWDAETSSLVYSVNHSLGHISSALLIMCIGAVGAIGAYTIQALSIA